MDLSPGSGEKCYPGECKGCGWNASVDARRKEQIRKKGLTKGEDGKRRLVLKKERDKPKPEYTELLEEGGGEHEKGKTEDPR